MHDLVLNSYFSRVNVYGNVDAMATLTSCRTGKAFTWRSHGSNARYFVRRLFPDRVLDFEHFALRRKDMPELTYPKRYLSDDHEDWREEVFKLLWTDAELQAFARDKWAMSKEDGHFYSERYEKIKYRVVPDSSGLVDVCYDDRPVMRAKLNEQGLWLPQIFALPLNP